MSINSARTGCNEIDKPKDIMTTTTSNTKPSVSKKCKW